MITIVTKSNIIYNGTATLNSTAGTTIALPHDVNSTSDYDVSVVLLGSSGFIGEVWIEKTTTSFTVYNSGSDTTTEFEYTIIYK